MTQVLVEALVDGGERLQCPILTCRAGKSNTKHKYKEVKKISENINSGFKTGGHRKNKNGTINKEICILSSDLTCTQDVFSVIAMVMNGGGRGAVSLTDPQQSGSASFLIKNPHLRGEKVFYCFIFCCNYLIENVAFHYFLYNISYFLYFPQCLTFVGSFFFFALFLLLLQFLFILLFLFIDLWF